METVKLTIDNKHVEVPKGTTILQAAQQAGQYSFPVLYEPASPGTGTQTRKLPGMCSGNSRQKKPGSRMLHRMYRRNDGIVSFSACHKCPQDRC